MIFGLDKIFSGGVTHEVKEKEKVEESPREKGLRLAARKEYVPAIDAFKECVEENPEKFFGFNALAVCYKNSGDLALAMKNFERALEFVESPEDEAKVYANIGNLYFSSGKPRAALSYYREAHSAVEKNPFYLVLIARAFIVLDEPERAAKVLASAEEIRGKLKNQKSDEERGLGHYLMGYCFLALGDEKKPFKYLERAFKANPGRFLIRFENDSADEKNLFYSLREDPRIKRLIKKYKARSSPAFWLLDD
jgi:tetratricopeptide (TPR) repeat protein